MLPEYLSRWAENMEKEAEVIREQAEAEKEQVLPRASAEQLPHSGKYGQIRAI